MFLYSIGVIFLLIRIAFKPGKLTIDDTSIIKRRVSLRDADFNIHMNNGNLQTNLDFGRYDLLIRMGVLKLAWNEKWRPIAGSTLIVFRKSLPLFASYEIHSHINCWDEKWIYFEQKVFYKKQLTAHAYIKALLRGPKGNITPAEIASKIGIERESSPMPEAIAQWKKADDLLIQLRNENSSNSIDESPALPASHN